MKVSIVGAWLRGTRSGHLNRVVGVVAAIGRESPPCFSRSFRTLMNQRSRIGDVAVGVDLEGLVRDYETVVDHKPFRRRSWSGQGRG